MRTNPESAGRQGTNTGLRLMHDVTLVTKHVCVLI